MQQLVAFGRLRDEVLDPGTRPGHHAIHYASQGYSATGIDSSPAGIELTPLSARRKIIRLEVDAVVEVGHQSPRAIAGRPSAWIGLPLATERIWSLAGDSVLAVVESTTVRGCGCHHGQMTDLPEHPASQQASESGAPSSNGAPQQIR